MVILSPVSNSVVRSFPALVGVASDNVGVAGLDVRLYRFSDRRFWTGSTWTTNSVAVP
jgi:hypothetical protein